MNELHLFAGAGGGILGSELLGFRTVCAVELEPYPASVLLARQNDGLLPPFPVWDDVRTFDGRPEFAFLENSPLLVGRGLARILGDLARIGYDAAWCVLGADAVGLPHRRARLWLLAHHACMYRQIWTVLEESGGRQTKREFGRLPGISLCQERWEASQGDVCVSVFRRPDDGVAPEVDELKALGNGQVPAVAATAFRVLLERFTNYNPQLTLF